MWDFKDAAIVFMILLGFGCALLLFFLGVTYNEQNYMDHGYVWIPKVEGHWELRNPEKVQK